MSDTFITIITIVIVAVVMFVFPLMATANQNDAITQTSVQTIVSDFVNTAAREGKITMNNYDNFMQKLSATGNSYDVELEVQILDDNYAYNLKQGDYVLAKVKNNNVTFGTQLKNFLYSAFGKDTIVIEADSSALVTTTGK